MHAYAQKNALNRFGPICQHVHTKATKFKRPYLCFRGRVFEWDKYQHCRTKMGKNGRGNSKMVDHKWRNIFYVRHRNWSCDSITWLRELNMRKYANRPNCCTTCYQQCWYVTLPVMNLLNNKVWYWFAGCGHVVQQRCQHCSCSKILSMNFTRINHLQCRVVSKVNLLNLRWGLLLKRFPNQK